MHPGGRNHPYGTEKQDRDADKFQFVQQNSLHIIGYQQIGICRFINLHIFYSLYFSVFSPYLPVCPYALQQRGAGLLCRVILYAWSDSVGRCVLLRYFLTCARQLYVAVHNIWRQK